MSAILEEKTDETYFTITNPAVVQATRKFFGAPSTKSVKSIPVGAIAHFKYFVYGIVMSTTEMKFKQAELADDFAQEFSYEYPNLTLEREGNTVKFSPELILDVRYDVEDILDGTLQNSK